MRIKILVLILLNITLGSCTDSIIGHKYVSSIKNARINFEHCYSVNGLFDHFPKSISNKSVVDMLLKIPNNTYYLGSYYIGFSFLILKMEGDSLGLYPKSYVYKTLYTNRNFIIDVAFSNYKYTDTLKQRNVALPGAYPIPYFEDLDFGLGSERFDLRTKGIDLVVDKNNVPDDLEVFVLKTGYGFFWKLKFDQDRPITLGDWKNGYSCGIAISKKNNMIVYWMMAW